jgi:hypothetical protein
MVLKHVSLQFNIQRIFNLQFISLAQISLTEHVEGDSVLDAQDQGYYFSRRQDLTETIYIRVGVGTIWYNYATVENARMDS